MAMESGDAIKEVASACAKASEAVKEAGSKLESKLITIDMLEMASELSMAASGAVLIFAIVAAPATGGTSLIVGATVVGGAAAVG